jgi:molybdate transport system substrate-binding protein
MTRSSPLKIISANGMREVIADTKTAYEAASGKKLAVTVVETGEIRRRVLGGEAFDVIMVPQAVADALEKAGKLTPASTVALIRIGFGLAARANAPLPDLSTPEALKRAFLAANKVLITDPTTGGVSGVHLMEVLEKLGIAQAMEDKLVPNPGGAIHAARVVAGEADLAVQAEHEIRSVPGAAFLPYPAPFARTMVMVGGIGTAAADTKAARDYLAFMTAEHTAQAYAAHHLTRG